ncbi:MAG TPA: 2-oxoacid:acceptor oxidoreductase subunit alpha, partial [bacterium]|nr:2-oxoacid:acceptor oxidoreductase subunit alpha [bacterium]
EKIRFLGPENADVTLVSWGSTKGAIFDALPKLTSSGMKINFLQIRMIWPFPKEAVTRILGRAKTVIGIEMNYTGQMCDLIRRETGIEIKHRILKWNGRPVSETEVVDAVSEIVQKKQEKVVLESGL